MNVLESLNGQQLGLGDKQYQLYSVDEFDDFSTFSNTFLMVAQMKFSDVILKYKG